MKKTLIVLVIILLVIVGYKFYLSKKVTPLPDGTIVVSTSTPVNRITDPGLYTFATQHDGVTRTWKVFVPKNYQASVKYPTIFVFHGGGGSADSISNETRFNVAADNRNILLVYPNATEGVNKWNTGPRKDMKHDGSTADDSGFVRKVLADVTKRFNVDTKKIYATGFSNGGMFTFRMACEMADIFAAIAPVGSRLMDHPCEPVRPVPMLFAVGDADPLLPFEGGPVSDTIPSIIKPKDTFKSAKVVLDAWKNKNSCTDESVVTFDKGDTTCETYNKCQPGAEITFCVVKDGGHTWPGGTYGGFKKQSVEDAYAKLVGKISKDFDATNEIITFFLKYSLATEPVINVSEGKQTAFNYNSGDTERSYIAYSPIKYNKKQPTAVVFNFHGGGGSAVNQMQTSQMNLTADKYGFIVIYPEGTPNKLGPAHRTWNAIGCCGNAVENNVDDITNFKDLLNDVKENFNIDPKKVFVTGHSNGAMMAEVLGCAWADKIAAVGSNAGGLYYPDCKPVRPVPIIMFHGVEDTAYPYDGGTITFDTLKNKPEYPSAEDNAFNWASRNDCQDETDITLEVGGVVCETYSACKNKADVGPSSVKELESPKPGSPSSQNFVPIKQQAPFSSEKSVQRSFQDNQATQSSNKIKPKPFQ